MGRLSNQTIAPPVEKITIEKRLGMAVKNWRTRLSLPQDELARRAGLQRSYISDVERGSRNVSLKSIEKLADALGISILTLFSEINAGASTEPLHAGELAEILMVEDTDTDLLLVTQALKKANITNRMFAVRDGAAALDFLFCTGEFSYRRINDQPQVILLDINLPKIDGLEVLRRIKADPRTRSIPVVMLTSSKHDLDIATCKRLGAQAYIVKPVDFQNFSAVTLQLSLQWALLKPTNLVGG
ncbi:MAG TPA: response regulator [Verrucomicrobiae bacterium]|nr:response regulator [Verrucomicrobiae bacterium]